MKTLFQVYSRLKGTEEWLEDHMPFETRDEAVEYIKTQWQNTHQYVILEEEITPEDILEANDALDAIGGDWQG